MSEAKENTGSIFSHKHNAILNKTHTKKTKEKRLSSQLPGGYPKKVATRPLLGTSVVPKNFNTSLPKSTDTMLKFSSTTKVIS